MGTEKNLDSILEHHKRGGLSTVEAIREGTEYKKGKRRIQYLFLAMAVVWGILRTGYIVTYLEPKNKNWDYQYCKSFIDRDLAESDSHSYLKIIGPKTGNTCDFILKNYKPRE